VKYWITPNSSSGPVPIDLISIGIVAEDGREFYAESSEVDWSKASSWTLETVKPQLDGKVMEREQIGYAIRNFTDGDEQPVFWGYFPAYDWVAFSWLFGTMTELPFHYPQLCLDIKQWAIELGDAELPNRWARAITRLPMRDGPRRPGPSGRPQSAAGERRAKGQKTRPVRRQGGRLGPAWRKRGGALGGAVSVGRVEV